MELSIEQNKFIEESLKGFNILVDACIGSGKTTAIQHLCDVLPSNKKILYLTYNKLLKLDAKKKIKNRNVTVTNYHGFAYMCLISQNIRAGISDLIQTFNKKRPYMKHYDVLMIDEYQDIEEELADMLNIIKEENPGIQIIAVGDMEQKIYDKTTLDVRKFIDGFLGERKTLEFTRCFRLSAAHAAKLGRIWNKTIVGVNPGCKISVMGRKEAAEFLKDQDPHDVLCLGSRQGDLSATLNYLEYNYPEKYNKKTIYASIMDDDGYSEPKEDSGIFTTFDSSKGLERKICVIFDFTKAYWTVRSRMPQQKYEILRNIFCVAASRGKEQIVFVHEYNELLDEEMLSTPTCGRKNFDNMAISGMFDFKYKEDVEECFSLLELKKLRDGGDFINVKTNDELIDISPCIGIYQESSYFKNYDLESDLSLAYEIDKDRSTMYQKEFYMGGVQKKILVLTALNTHQNRYIDQVDMPFITEEAAGLIHERLGGVFTKNENVQVRCEIPFMDGSFEALGFADVVKKDTVYELKFVEDLKHEHFLQCACYMIALGLKKGILWNVRDNTMWDIKIKDQKRFLDSVTNAITKGAIRRYIK